MLKHENQFLRWSSNKIATLDEKNNIHRFLLMSSANNKKMLFLSDIMITAKLLFLKCSLLLLLIMFEQ